MGDEPSNSELARRLESIERMLASVVGHPEYAADKRGTDFRLNEAEHDLAQERRDRAAADEQERRDRAEAIKAVHDRITAQAKAGAEHRMHWREVLLMGVLPAAVALVGVLVTVWLSRHGGGH